MFFPFMDYQTVDFDLDSNGSTVVYTTTQNCLIFFQQTQDFDFDGIGESVSIFVDDPWGGWQIFQANSNGDDFQHGNIQVIRAGIDIKANRVNEGFAGRLHIFKLPTSA
jgi:hypothetical protein